MPANRILDSGIDPVLIDIATTTFRDLLFRDLIQIILPYGSSVSIFEIGLNPSTGGVFLSQVTAGIVSIIGGLIRLYSNGQLID